MIYEVRVKTGAKGPEGVESAADGSLVVRTHARPHEGEANKAVLSLLAEHLGVPKSSLLIVSGSKSKLKKVELK